jgi:hypothetical protein
MIDDKLKTQKLFRKLSISKYLVRRLSVLFHFQSSETQILDTSIHI